jgi:hypothetical protein
MKNFLHSIKKGIFPFIIAFAALSVSASAAFYSVSGLSKLFAGASFEVIIMATSLEVAKLVIASLLYQYWDTLNKWLKLYLSIAALVLVLITSMGIYGFLSAAYQTTASEMSVVDNKVKFLTQKKDFYESDLARYNKELEIIGANINNLSTAKSSQIQVRDTTSTTGFRTTVSTTELRMAQKRIEVEEVNRKAVQAKREVAADSLQKYQLAILDLENTSEVAGELGPLKYLSGLTGIPMDKIINYLLLIIIFVFDPLAISLVITANFAFDQIKPKKEMSIEETVGGMRKVVDSYDSLMGELEDDFSEWDDLDEEEEPNEDLKRSAEKYKAKNIEIIDPEVVKPEKQEFLKELDEIEDKVSQKEIIEEQNLKIESLYGELTKANEEINELDRAAIKIVDSIKHIDDYLKNHAPYYSPDIANWDEVKLGFAEESDYIDKRKPRSKPKGKNDDVIIY